MIAIENVRLFDEVQARTRDLSESLEQQTATSEVLQVISCSPGELEPVFRSMLENATRVCGASFGTMNLWDGEKYNLAAGYNVPPAFSDFRIKTPIRPHPGTTLEAVVKTHKFARFMTSGRPQRTVPVFPTWSRWRRSPAPGRFWSCPC